MNNAEFAAILNRKVYEFEIIDGYISVTHKSYVDLPSCTTLPEGIQFNNAGNVNLSSCTTLPEGIKFNNAGNVNLYSCTTLPEGIKFNNAGNVYLGSCLTLPDGIQFNNAGFVNLRSCTTPQMYRGKLIDLRHIDGCTMLIQSTRKTGGMSVMRSRYFGGGDIAKLKQCYVAQSGEFYAHGDTIAKAMRDVRFKIDQLNFDASDLVALIKKRGTVTFNDFRLITGACVGGLEHGMITAGITAGTEEMPLKDVMRLAHGPYGKQFTQLFA
jgi:hypothetical protein